MAVAIKYEIRFSGSGWASPQPHITIVVEAIAANGARTFATAESCDATKRKDRPRQDRSGRSRFAAMMEHLSGLAWPRLGAVAAPSPVRFLVDDVRGRVLWCRRWYPRLT